VFFFYHERFNFKQSLVGQLNIKFSVVAEQEFLLSVCTVGLFSLNPWLIYSK